MKILKFLTFIYLFVTISFSSVSDSVTLGWNRSLSPEASGYRIYYGYSSNIYTNTITIGDTNEFSINGLSSGATYYFAASAFDNAGRESALSPEISYTIPNDAVVTNIFNLTNIINIIITNYISTYTINTNLGKGAVFIGVKLKYGTDFLHMKEERIMIKSFSNPPSYFYSSSLIITNNPF